MLSPRDKLILAVFLACLQNAGLPETVPARKDERLPLPTFKIPEPPAQPPLVVTSGGQRLLLGHTDAVVIWEAGDGGQKTLKSNRPGWWLINYPLDRIKGLERKTEDEIAGILFGRTRKKIKNWYFKTPGKAVAEPSKPRGPAPIAISDKPDLIVHAGHPKAADSNLGTQAAPLKSISEAVRRAQAGVTIHVYPGVYRESAKIEESGTKEQPLRLEGVRGAGGQMPVVSGNDIFPPDAWKPVRGLSGVFRADLFTGRLGTVSVNGKTLTERSVPHELKEGEYCLNRASKDFVNLRFNGKMAPGEGARQSGKKWKRIRTDDEGFIDLVGAFGESGRNAVSWASTFVWVPLKKKRKTEWHPDFPEPITGRVEVKGEFRAARMSGSSLGAQVNKYRIWCNGELLPSVIFSSASDFQLELPHPTRNYGFSDRWEYFRFQEGWNHLVFQWDTTTRPAKSKFRFGVPKGIDSYVTSAIPPADRSKPGDGAQKPFIAEYLVLGPFESSPDRGVYVRLPGGANPNSEEIDLAARGSELISVSGDFVEVRGFEIRHGAQFQQRAQVTFEGEGILLEGCLLRDSEVSAISFKCTKDRSAAPLILRNNWIVNPGNVGITGVGTSDRLTAENQNTTTPGRSSIIIEYNTVTNNNWAGFPSFWASGGMKVFRLTGAIIRGNTVIGGSGPGIWLDWEHYGNRLEGNLFLNGWALAIGIEASPGPNLMANNLCIDLRPGPVWFRHALLSWSSDRNYAINNTLDGRWNPLPAWQNKVGSGGIYLGEGGPDRKTRWVPLRDRRQVILNNIITGSHSALKRKKNDIVGANITDRGTGAAHLDADPEFRNPKAGDYRLKADSPANRLGVENEHSRLVRHDFYGLPRFADTGRSVGAFRMEVRPQDRTKAMVEVELADGTFQRLYQPRLPIPRQSRNILQADEVFEMPLIGSDWKDDAVYSHEGKPLWKLSFLARGGLLNESVGCNRKEWKGEMVWNDVKSRFADAKAEDASVVAAAGRREGHGIGSHGQERAILSFIAPRKGRYLLYLQNGRVSLWGQHQQIGLNVIHFRMNQPNGRSLHYAQTCAKERRAPRVNLVIPMEPGEELSLVQNTDANGGGGGAFFTDYTIKVGYFEE